MPKTIRIIVPDAVYKRLKARADKAGVPLPDYIASELTEMVRPTIEEFCEHLRSRAPVEGELNIVEVLRQEREKRG